MRGLPRRLHTAQDLPRLTRSRLGCAVPFALAENPRRGPHAKATLAGHLGPIQITSHCGSTSSPRTGKTRTNGSIPHEREGPYQREHSARTGKARTNGGQSARTGKAGSNGGKSHHRGEPVRPGIVDGPGVASFGLGGSALRPLEQGYRVNRGAGHVPQAQWRHRQHELVPVTLAAGLGQLFQVGVVDQP